MRASLALIGLLAGCHRVLGLEPASVPIDSAIDTSFMDAPPPGTLCAGALYFQECALETDVQDVTLAQPIDTDSAICTRVKAQPNQPSDGPDVCVILAHDIHVATMLQVTGSRPLAVFALGNFTIDQGGGFDASSTATTLGPNANQSMDCAAPSGQNQGTSQNAAGGGAGGSLGGQGGDGGVGATMMAQSRSTFVPPFLRAGCRGGDGGVGPFGAPVAAVGGAPGGAIYLVAAGTLTNNGSVLANGVGGKGGAKTGNTGNMCGAGGGGSGGVIALEAQAIMLGATSLLQASGGGGGGGADGTVGSGTDGKSPVPATPNTGALPGSGGATGLDGGRGNQTGDPNGNHGKPTSFGVQQGGGGGGGGGAGVIRLLPASTTRNGTQVPTPT